MLLFCCGEALYPSHVNLSGVFVSAPKRGQMRRFIGLCHALGVRVDLTDAQHSDCGLTCTCLWDNVRSADMPRAKEGG